MYFDRSPKKIFLLIIEIQCPPLLRMRAKCSVIFRKIKTLFQTMKDYDFGTDESNIYRNMKKNQTYSMVTMSFQNPYHTNFVGVTL